MVEITGSSVAHVAVAGGGGACGSGITNCGIFFVGPEAPGCEIFGELVLVVNEKSGIIKIL